MKRFSPIVMHNHDTCGGVGCVQENNEGDA